MSIRRFVKLMTLSLYLFLRTSIANSTGLSNDFLFYVHYFEFSKGYVFNVNQSAQYNKYFSQNSPLSLELKENKIDYVAHWYNDFGLEYIRKGNGSNGAMTWYTWDWAKNLGALDRHPLLGWYKGDDTNILNWQCYWLLKSGITAVNITGPIDISNWKEPSNKHYWKFQLFENTYYFKLLKYIPWVKYKGSIMNITANWNQMIGYFFSTYNNYYKVCYNNKYYPVMYVFEGEGLRNSFDNLRSSKRLKKFLISQANKAIIKGFGGICLFVRHPTSDKILSRKDLESNGVLYIPAGYSNMEGAKERRSRSYYELVNNMKMPNERAIVNVVTSHHSVSPHPSNWPQKGSTPILFELAIRRATDWVLSNPALPKIIQIYNVAEWAEGGPGLQPNFRDGFGYLNSLKNVVENFISEKEDHSIKAIPKLEP